MADQERAGPADAPGGEPPPVPAPAPGNGDASGGEAPGPTPGRGPGKGDASGGEAPGSTPGPGTGDGDGIVRVALWGTGIFAGVATAAAAAPDTFGGPALVLDVVLFGAGCVLFVMAFLRAADRSRTDAIGIGGLFFLAGDVAPPDVRRRLIGALVIQVVVGLTTAGIRPYTNLAAGTLVPVFGLGLCGLWAARHGKFGHRTPPPDWPGRRGPSRSRPA